MARARKPRFGRWETDFSLAPITELHDPNPTRVLLWLPKGLHEDKGWRGCAQFGVVYKGHEGKPMPKAFAHNGDWEYTAWMPEPGGPDAGL